MPGPKGQVYPQRDGRFTLENGETKGTKGSVSDPEDAMEDLKRVTKK